MVARARPSPTSPSPPHLHRRNPQRDHARNTTTRTTSMTVSPDAVADLALDVFDRLPNKCKPRPRSDGSREWIPLSGIVIAKGTMITTALFEIGLLMNQ
jgi:hypothetical protein